MFTAFLTLRPNSRSSKRQYRRAVDELIAAIEPVGWRWVSVEPIGTSVEINFYRAR